jgi:endonuclease/exonuclease/phosphatase family metal-dependent hydrolase
LVIYEKISSFFTCPLCVFLLLAKQKIVFTGIGVNMKQFLSIYFFLWVWIKTGFFSFGQQAFINEMLFFSYLPNGINADQSFFTPWDSIKEPIVISIAEAKLLPSATKVRVQGVLTVTHQFGGPAYIQDDTGGIPVYDSLIHGPGLFHIGEGVKVTGKLAVFNQQVQLVDITAVEIVGPVEPVQPKRVRIEELADLEGMLITIPAVKFLEPTGLLYPDSNYLILDDSGSMELRIDGDVHGLLGKYVPHTSENITGILGNFRGTLQLLPRFMEDLPGTSPYVPRGSDILPDETLDIITWNMEFFGATLPGFGPADVRLQMQNALSILKDSRPDVIAVQEISDPELLEELIRSLPGYALDCSDRFSRSFEKPDPTFPEQRLCFVYNTKVMEMISSRTLFETIYDEARTDGNDALKDYPTGTASSFWASGRLPYMMEVDATIQDIKKRLIFINIHAKSGANSIDLERKRFDIKVLKDSLDVFYPEKNVVLLGDYNDDLDESIGGGTSTYEVIIQDSNYKGISLSLSEAGLRSYMYHDHMIDHIILTNELFDIYLEGSAQLIIPFSSIANYARTTSDHLPVLARLLPGLRWKTMDEKQEKFNQAKIARYYPNPFTRTIKVVVDQNLSLPIKVSLLDLGGNILFGGVDQFIDGECDLDLRGFALKPGVYFLLLKYGSETKSIRLIKW